MKSSRRIHLLICSNDAKANLSCKHLHHAPLIVIADRHDHILVLLYSSEDVATYLGPDPDPDLGTFRTVHSIHIFRTASVDAHSILRVNQRFPIRGNFSENNFRVSEGIGTTNCHSQSVGILTF